MKVLHVITGLGEGGAEAVLTRLCEGDTANSHTVVSLLDRGKYAPRLEAAGVRVHTLGMSRGPVTVNGLVQLWRLLRRERPQVVQTWLYHADLIGGIAARLAGNRRVFWNLRNTAMVPSRTTRLVARLCAVLSYVVPLRIIACASRAQEEHARIGYSRRRMRTIPNGYDLDSIKFDPDARERVRLDLGVPNDRTLIGYVARFDPQKDHASLLRALGEVKRRGMDFHCVLVGRDLTTDNRAIAELLAAEELTSMVTLYGPAKDVVPVMSALDLHVMASAFGEGFPNVLAEAMACGTPCVTTDVGDAAMIVGDHGWVVPPSRADLLAAAVTAALECKTDGSRWAALRTDVRQSIEQRFSVEAMVGRYVQAWSEAD